MTELDEMYGPKMRALTKLQRAFVEAYMLNGQENAAAAYRLAGYSTNSDTAVRVEASKLVHATKIQEAIQEHAARHIVGQVPGAINTIVSIMANERAKDADRLVAAKMVLGAAGLGSIQKFQVEHTHEIGVDDALRMLADLSFHKIPLPALPAPIDITPKK